MCDHYPINYLPVTLPLPCWLMRLSHWAMTSVVRVFLLTLATLLGTLLLNETVQVVGESRPLMDAAAALITRINP